MTISVAFDFSDLYDENKSLVFSYPLPSELIPRIGENVLFYKDEHYSTEPIIEGEVKAVYWALGRNSAVGVTIVVEGYISDEAVGIIPAIYGNDINTRIITDVTEWATRFLDEARKAKMSTRSYRTIFRELIWAKNHQNEPDSSRPADLSLYCRDGRLLEFNEWADLVLSGEIPQTKIMAQQSVGKGAYRELVDSLTRLKA